MKMMWVDVGKGESGCYILLFCHQILHATNLMEVKQEYLLIKDDNNICKSET